MKLINSNTPPFFANVYDKQVFVDINDGTGFCKVFKIMHPSIVKLSNFYCSLMIIEFPDAYQNICIFMLEGILKYKIKYSLSRFLYIYSYSRIIDVSRKKKIKEVSYDCDTVISKGSSPTLKIDVKKYFDQWDNKWKNIMFRFFVKEESITSIAKDEKITNWGLTCAIKRKLQDARTHNARRMDKTKTNQ